MKELHYNKFIEGRQYSKKDIYELLKVPPHRQGGNWDTGYRSYEDAIFIFCNIESSGRTGDDHGNYFIDSDNLFWKAKNKSHQEQPQIKRMISSKEENLIFYRYDSRDPFTFWGRGIASDVKDRSPVELVWKKKYSNVHNTDVDESSYKEGKASKVYVNKYERDPVARQKCIEHYGNKCQICNMNFGEVFGEVGEGFIHVHHLLPLGEIKEEYKVNPKKDLLPVCPNCHAMLHKKVPPYTPEELKEILKDQKEKTNG